MASGYLKEAEIRLETAENSFKREFYSYVVRQAQETVELSLKSILRLVGIEPPKWHDVGIALRKERERFPEWFQSEIDELAFISRELRGERERSMYGDEEMGLPPSEIYTKYDGEQALKWAKKVFEACKKLVEQY